MKYTSTNLSRELFFWSLRRVLEALFHGIEIGIGDDWDM
jgi:hypothetical protein